MNDNINQLKLAYGEGIYYFDGCRAHSLQLNEINKRFSDEQQDILYNE